MCLYVNNRKHTFNIFTGKPVPRRLLFSKTVWKVLKVDEKTGKVFTPYVRETIKFNDDGKWESKVFSRKQFANTFYGQKTSAGFHALLDYEEAKTLADCLWTSGCVVIVCKAVIPKGSYVFYGKHNDICSNRMIVYREGR